MRKPPSHINEAEVIAYAILTADMPSTGKCRHFIYGEFFDEFKCLAIAKYADVDGYYLFFCDENWEPIDDGFHDTLADLREQAAFEFENVDASWIFLSPDDHGSK